MITTEQMLIRKNDAHEEKSMLALLLFLGLARGKRLQSEIYPVTFVDETYFKSDRACC